MRFGFEDAAVGVGAGAFALQGGSEGRSARLWAESGYPQDRFRTAEQNELVHDVYAKTLRASSARLESVDTFSGRLRDDIWQYKDRADSDFERSQYASKFATFITENLPEGYNLSDYDAILPLPSSAASLEKRGGFSPVAMLAEHLSEQTGLPVAANILEDVSDVTQKGLSREGRWKHAEESHFRILDESQVAGKRFLMLDDVRTTGATIKSAIETVGGANPAQLDALTLANRPWQETYADLQKFYATEGSYAGWLDERSQPQLAFPPVDKYPPTPSQQAALEHGFGPAVTIAGPGSGKSRTLIERLKNLTHENMATPDDVLTLVFGKKAELELSERAREIGGDWNISTLDSFAYNLVRENYGRLGYSAGSHNNDAEFRVLVRRRKESVRR